MNNHQGTKIIRLVGTWINDYLPDRNVVSDKTVTNYETAMSLFLDFLEQKKHITVGTLSPQCFATVNIEDWLDWLSKTRKCGSNTCNNRLSALRSFLKYVARTDKSFAYLYADAQTIPLRKVANKPVKGISRNGLKAFFSVFTQSTNTGKKYLTLFTLMYNCGLRLDEILSIRIKNLRLEAPHPSVTVMGKGSKIRTLTILPKTKAMLEAYMRVFHKGQANELSYLFYSRNLGPTGKCSQMAVSKQLKLHAAKAHELCADVPPNFHCHQLRHACASHLLENGLNVVQLSRFLGHRNLSTTMVYIDVNLAMKQAALEKMDDDSTKGIKKKWKNSDSLSKACGIRKLEEK
jgi:site-specific recombinase XerD